MSIKQAIEALEVAQDALDISQSLQESAKSNHYPKTLAAYEQSRAALAALRSMPAEPVAWFDPAQAGPFGNPLVWNEREMERQGKALPEIKRTFYTGKYAVPNSWMAFYATQPTEAVRMSEAVVICTCAAKDMPFGRCCKLAPLLGEAEIMAAAKQAGFNLDPTPNMLFTVRGNAVQVINLARAVEQATAARLGVKWGDV